MGGGGGVRMDGGGEKRRRKNEDEAEDSLPQLCTDPTLQTTCRRERQFSAHESSKKNCGSAHVLERPTV